VGSSARALFGQVHGGRPKASRDIQPLWYRIDRQHGPRTGGYRRLDGTQADRAQAEHGDAVARLDPAFGHRVIAGAHHIAGEQRDIVADGIRDCAQGQVGHRYQRLLCLRALE